MKRITSVIVCMLLFGFSVMAQDIQLTGKVTDADGTALPGVSVVVKGTTIGTATGADGMYSLSVPADATIVFSSMGYQTKEVALAGQTTLDVTLEMEATGLEEIVVTALGVSRDKKSLGYAVQEVNGEELDRAKNTNVINTLSGRVAGLQVKANSNFGGSSNILMRGASSIEGNNQVLFIVDGVPVSNLNTNNLYQEAGRSGYDYGNPVADINSNDIESVSVLKGAAATALYGSRAANGVILINTKKGKKNSLSVRVGHSTMFHVADKSTYPEHQQEYGQGYGPYYSGSDYPGLYYYDFDGDGVDDYVPPSTEDASMGSKFNPDLMVFQWDAFYPESPTYMQKSPYVAGANGIDYFFQTGHTYTTDAEIAGGTEVSTYRLSYANTTADGIMPNSELKKNSLTFSGSYDLTKKMKISSQVQYINTYTKGRNHTGYSDNIMSSFRQWYNVGVDIKQQEDLYNLTGKNITWNPNSEDDLTPIYWDNPYFQRYENYQDDTRDRVVGYVKFDYELADGLNFMAQYSIDDYTFLQEERKAIGSVSGEFGVVTASGKPSATSGYLRNTIQRRETNFDAMLRYHKVFGDLDLNAFAGTNLRRVFYERVKESTNGGLAVPEIYAISNSASAPLPNEEVLQRIGVDGVFGSVSLGYLNMLYLDATLRQDWSSTLPADERAYLYPGISGSFVFSELVDATWLNNGKIRLNYAKVGNDAPWGVTKDIYGIQAPFGSTVLVAPSAYKRNPNIKPELSTTKEAGLAMNMFNFRAGFDLALYQINTVNQITALPVSDATGRTYKYVNLGEIENKGIELSVNFVPVRTSDFEWKLDLNWAKNLNKVVALGEGITNYQINSLQGGLTINAREGEPLGSIQGTDFVYAPDGQKVIRSSGYYAKTSTSDEIIGNIQPDWNAGISNTFSYKGLTASFLIDIQKGGDIFSLDLWYGMGTGLYPETVGNNELGNPKRDPVLPIYDADDNIIGYEEATGGLLLDGVVGVDENDDGEFDSYVENTRRINGDRYSAYGWATSPNARYVYDASYVKLRELTIGYDIPANVFGNTFIKGANVSLVGSNLWIIHKNLPYADPEASQGAGNTQGWQSGVMPATRNFGFKVNLIF